MKTQTQSPLQRIKRVMDYHQKKGYNSERCNALYKKIINEKFNKNKKEEKKEEK
jgi:hypothetical protein